MKIQIFVPLPLKKRYTPWPLHFGTDISTVKITAKFEIISLYRITALIVEELTMENVGQQTILLEIGKSLHFGTGISTVKMVAKLEILSLYRAYFQENPYISHLIIKEVRKEVNT